MSQKLTPKNSVSWSTFRNIFYVCVQTLQKYPQELYIIIYVTCSIYQKYMYHSSKIFSTYVELMTTSADRYLS